MPAAAIEINAVLGSDNDLPINTLVQFSNADIGGETTYLWAILDQPIGAADALSSLVIENPTFTPQKEGTYLFQLIVNQGAADEKTDTVIAAVRHLKTRERAPAAAEKTEDSARGWAVASNSQFSLIESAYSNPSIIVGTAGAAGIIRGDVVRPSTVATIKSGLPGAEVVPTFVEVTPPTVASQWAQLWGICEGGVDGGASPASGDLIIVRVLGILPFEVALGGAAAGSPVYVTTAGVLTATLPTAAGASRRVIGYVLATGTGGDEIIMVHGIPSGLLDSTGDLDWSEAGVIAGGGGGGWHQRLSWQQLSIPDSQTAVRLTRDGTAVTDFLNPKDGSAMGLTVNLDGNAAGSALVVELFAGGAATGLIATVGIGQATTFQQRRKDQVPFGAEDILDLRVTTTGAWTGTGLDVVATLEFED